LIRAIASTGFAYPIGIRRTPTRVDVVGVETWDVQHRDDQQVVAVNVNTVRSGAIPGRVHRLQAVHFVTAHTKRDSPRRWRGRCGWRRSGCRSDSRCWRWCGGRCRCSGRCRCGGWGALKWSQDLNRRWRAYLKETYCPIRGLRRLVCIKPKIIQRAPANRIGVLIGCKRFALPTHGIGSLDRRPRSAAVTLVVLCAVKYPSRVLGRRMEADVAYVYSGSQGNTERLNGTIEVLVIGRGNSISFRRFFAVF